MKLLDIKSLINGEIINDREFTSLGLAVSKCNEKLLSFIVKQAIQNQILNRSQIPNQP